MGSRWGLRKCAAAVLAASVVLSRGAPAVADVPISDAARTHFAAGVALLQDPKAPRYEEAYREFKTAYAASPSYKILGNLGLCAMKIERDAEAIAAYEGYLAHAGAELTPAERDQAQRDLLTLKAGVVTVTVSSNPAGASIADVRTPVEGPDVRNTYGAAAGPLVLGVRRGHHVITARLAGYVDETWEFEASGATLPPHAFTMVPVAPPPVASETTRPLPVAAYISGAATLGLAIAGAATGWTAIQKQHDYDGLNDGYHYSAAQSARSAGVTLDVVADSLGGAALLGAILTGYFVITRPAVEHPAPTGLAPRAAPLTGIAEAAGGGPGAAGHVEGVELMWVY